MPSVTSEAVVVGYSTQITSVKKWKAFYTLSWRISEDEGNYVFCIWYAL